MVLDELSFTFSNMVEIMGATIVLASSWVWMRSQFHTQQARIQIVERDVSAHAVKSDSNMQVLTGKIDNLVAKIGIQSEAIVRIEAHGQIVEERVQNYLRHKSL